MLLTSLLSLVVVVEIEPVEFAACAIHAEKILRTPTYSTRSDETVKGSPTRNWPAESVIDAEKKHLPGLHLLYKN
jgi:hypothetical protein